MKRYFLPLMCLTLLACNSLLPYKGQSLDDLHRVIQTPEKYQGEVVSFTGVIRGLTEDIRQLKLVLKVETPLYYYATGKDPLSYQLLLVTFQKENHLLTCFSVGYTIKILATIDRFETRTNHLGISIAVLHLQALAVTDRAEKKDFFHSYSPDKQLYESWAAGRLFFKETPKQIITRFPAKEVNTPKAAQKQVAIAVEKKPQISSEPTELVFEEEEPFMLPPDEPQEQAAELAEKQEDVPESLPDEQMQQ